MDKYSEETIEHFVKRLGVALYVRGYSQSKFAAKIGVSRAALTTYITKTNFPKLDTFRRMCEALGCSADYLLGIDDKREETAVFDAAAKLVCELRDKQQGVIDGET